MHRQKLTVLIFQLIPVLLFSQWQEKNIMTGMTLTAVQFHDSNTGFVTGGNIVFKTATGGDSWAPSFTGNALTFLEDVRIIDAHTVIAVGFDFNINKSVIVKTVNNGDSWEPINTGYDIPLKEVYFINADTGFCSGANGAILKTTDAGVHWTSLNTGANGDLQSIFFMNDSTGIAVGGAPSAGIILRTTNSGDSWEEITDPAGNYLQSVYFADQQVGYIVGWNGSIFKSEDAGASWSPQTSVNMEGNLEVFFTDLSTGYIAGGQSNEASIQKTSNGGQLWEEIGPDIHQGLAGIHFSSPASGYAVGINGTVLKTESGGVSTNQIANPAYFANTYPNPATDKLIIESVQNEIITSVKVYNSQGRLIDQKDIAAIKTEIDVSHYKSGNYYLMITSGSHQWIQKAVKI